MLCWDQKVQQAPQGVSLIAAVNDLEELAEKCGRGGLEGRVQRRQQVLNRALQRVKVLKTQPKESSKNLASGTNPGKHAMVAVEADLSPGLGFHIPFDLSWWAANPF